MQKVTLVGAVYHNGSNLVRPNAQIPIFNTHYTRMRHSNNCCHARIGRSAMPRLTYRPSVLLKYSTIAFTSPSDAGAPRATMFCTTALQPAASMRWLVTTSTA